MSVRKEKFVVVRQSDGMILDGGYTPALMKKSWGTKSKYRDTHNGLVMAYRNGNGDWDVAPNSKNACCVFIDVAPVEF